ncbi:ORF6N domain-containing protein [bacterium]|nr:ORF6N domain-containing protein [bacterium]
MKSETDVTRVESITYLIRGERVMLDHDLAELYQIPTKRIKEQVKRNLKRFPKDFMFVLSEQELTNLRSQFATSSSGWGGNRVSPFAFTEQGIAMLSSVLKSERAISVNIAIMRAFVQMRRLVTSNKESPTNELSDLVRGANNTKFWIRSRIENRRKFRVS